MSENSIVPSMERILNAVNSDLNNFSNNEIAQENTNNETDNTDYVFDAEKWYLQNYPKKVNIKKEDIDEPIFSISNEDKTPKKSDMSKGNIILLAIALIVLIGFCLYVFLQ